MRRPFLSVCLVFGLLAGFTGRSIGQTETVSGIVRDINTYIKLRGVNIVVSGTNIGTSSDYSGQFSLRIPGATGQELRINFMHIGYEPWGTSLDSLKKMDTVYLQPRIIQLPGVQVEAEASREKMEIAKDLPQTVSVIESKNFEIQGYVDAGDLLRVDHSVQIEEELSGKKFAAIRGGNPDDVVVLYNGVKMNNSYDNVFDLSLIDLTDLDRFEIIKGSNTALYGPEAFSGVINIVPRLEQDYTVKFQQRLGTYRSGNWGLHLYKKIDRLYGSYSFTKGGTEREFSGLESNANLTNASLNHTANLSYRFSENDDGSTNSLGLMWLYTSLDHENQRDNELLNNFNNLISAKYSGNLSKIRNLAISFSWRQLEEDQFLSFSDGQLTGAVTRGIQDRSWYANAEKSVKWNRAELLLGYQYQDARLVDELDQRTNFGGPQTVPLSANYDRTHHGFVGIAKYHGEAGADFLQNFNLDFSLRHDRVKDLQSDVVYPPGVMPTSDLDNEWNDTMFKFAVGLEGYKDDLSLSGFFNYGRNVKFPTLFQQVSTPDQSGLEPEENRSLEIGVLVAREIPDHPSLFGWQLSGSYFLNNYTNKFVEIRNVFGGRGQFTSRLLARISGLEGTSSLFLFRKKVAVELGIARYFISDQEAFPFKSDFKGTLNFSIDHAGYSFQIFAFKESEQTGLVLDQDQNVSAVELPDYRNLDVHLSKSFEVFNFKLFGNISARNLLKDGEVELLGLNIRDRRFYVTFGAQY